MCRLEDASGARAFGAASCVHRRVLPRCALQVLPRLQNIQHQRTLKIGVSPLSVNKVGEMGPAALWAGYG